MATGRAIWDRKTEIRKVGQGDMLMLISSMNTVWRQIMGHVPQNPLDINEDVYDLKYKADDLNIIENYSNTRNLSAPAIFLDEWGTSGKIRPTLETLQKLVTKLNLYGPMCEIAKILGDPQPHRPNVGPGARINTDITEILCEKYIEDMDTIHTDQLTIASEFNKNIDKAINENDEFKNKVFPDFNMPQSLRSTRMFDVDIPDLIEFSQTISNSASDRLSSGNLPAVLNQDIHSVLDTVPSITVQSATSESIQTSQTFSDDLPVVVSTMNRSVEENGNIRYQESVENSQSGDFNQDSANLPLMLLSINKSEQNKTFPGMEYKYSQLKKITRGFADESDPKNKLGGLLAKGGFGEVYVGFDFYNHPIAIKRLIGDNIKCDILEKQFNAEIEMSLFKHVNLVEILGYSIDGPEKLIVSEYINGGNLFEKIKEKVLNTSMRLKIMTGTARALQYMHYGTDRTMIHKDVKSVNILLTEDCTPKLCDYGLVREDTNTMNTIFIGTRAYLAPEAINNTITPKMDVFSYGIVLLELLTGLEPVIPCKDGSTKNIEIFIMDELYQKGNKDVITPLLDSIVEGWPIANSLFKLATKCLSDWSNRPNSNDVFNYLVDLQKF